MKYSRSRRRRLILDILTAVSIVDMVAIFLNNYIYGTSTILTVGNGRTIATHSVNGILQTLLFLMCIVMACLDYKKGALVGVILTFIMTFSTMVSIITLNTSIPLPGMVSGVFSLVTILIIAFLAHRTEMRTYTDATTGLPNINGFINILDKRLTYRIPGCLVFVQLDNLRSINDDHGHEAGDAILKEVGRRIQEIVGKENVLGRVSGAEFGFVLDGQNGNTEIVNKIINSIAQKITIGEENELLNFYLEGKAGIAEFDEEIIPRDILMKQADVALIQACASEKESVCIYTELMTDKINELKEVERKIRDALDNDYFYMNYQPQYSVTDQKLRGFEALLRMKLPDGSVLSPGIFIPVAEKSNLICQIDEYVLKRVTREFTDIVRKNPGIVISVNVSASGIVRSEFAPMVEWILKENNFPASCLEIEITEYSFADSSEQTINNILDLRKLGVKFALDDFGSGYTSLSRLMKLPINVLKVDKSMIDEVDRSEKNRSFIDSIGNMGHLMDCEVILEGVETESQLKEIRHIACDYIQGYIWGRPVEYSVAVQMV